MTPAEWAYLAAALGYSALEYWLGKSRRFEPNSAIEALLTLARLVLRNRK